jgi:voltage-gated sodium channel
MMRDKVRIFIEKPWVTTAITWVILINAVTLGLETSDYMVERFGILLTVIDRLALGIFTLEILLKLFGWRKDFFRSGWNIFDILIVTIAWLPTTGALSVLRALRVLRILRLLSVSPQLNRVVTAIGKSIPGMFSVTGVLSLIFYVASVIATKLFGGHPSPEMQEWFGTLSASAYTLFQIMTLESWSMGIVRPTMEIFPQAWIFFVPFIIVTSFAVLNLFIGIIVDAMQHVHEEEREEEDKAELKQFTGPEMDALHNRFDGLQGELAELRKLLVKAQN